ncbi:MAG: quinone-dependent dihydroorotate dehydrogenase [Gammaproteobacteria bacterium]|nr:quinone-dependent dihydroorotate dehydrogenase [Gammaproteobacteria bacterium]MCF6231063.1 quinone-dependent dihydroorotate dehydrogenase [Gammaproteobacteria bacterium]
MLYSLLRPLLFKMEPERAHHFTLKAIHRLHTLGLTRLIRPRINTTPTTVMGIEFPNQVGLAAGLDKNGEYIDALAALGFGFIEIGTITPRPQAGNPQPRMFRLPQAQAIINRMGFNNHGVEQLVENVKKAHYKGILGINIGKNADTPMAQATEDYLICLRKVYPYASYITANISSPNTKNLRQLQDSTELGGLLSALKKEQKKLAEQHGKYVPMVLKIAPDLSSEQVKAIAELLLHYAFDGVIATNTTINRDTVQGLEHGGEAGGLSGAPVREAATAVIMQLAEHLKGEIPIIGAGGILSGAHAQQKIAAGASLVQLYSGLIYRGPALIKESIKVLNAS